MPELELPHSHGCLVCGRDNPIGLQLQLRVTEASGVVTSRFTPRPEHIGFVGIIHGGLLATVLDEAMVWAATWTGRRFCVCGEMTVRFRQNAKVGEELNIVTGIQTSRPRLIQTWGQVLGPTGQLIANASGKYIPLPLDRHLAFVESLVPEPATQQALQYLKSEPT